MEEHQQEQHQPSKNSTNQARIAPTKQFSLHTIFHSANSKTQANNWRPNAVYKRKKKHEAPMAPAPSAGRKRQWEWRFPAPKLPSPAPSAAAWRDKTGQSANTTGVLQFMVKSPIRLARSSSSWHLSAMHEVASSTGVSHAGYVQKQHPLENTSKTALVWEICHTSLRLYNSYDLVWEHTINTPIVP